LILQDLNWPHTLVAEIPDPSRPDLSPFPTLAAKYRSARASVDAKIKHPTLEKSYLLEKLKVRVTGIIFFDKKAHSLSHAPNDLEIHPVLDLEFPDNR
jgi:hypothetical protein